MQSPSGVLFLYHSKRRISPPFGLLWAPPQQVVVISVCYPWKKWFWFISPLFNFFISFFLALNPLTVDYYCLLISFKFFSLTKSGSIIHIYLRGSIIHKICGNKLINFGVIPIFHHGLFLSFSIIIYINRSCKIFFWYFLFNILIFMNLWYKCKTYENGSFFL